MLQYILYSTLVEHQQSHKTVLQIASHSQSVTAHYIIATGRGTVIDHWPIPLRAYNS